jgi:hypothetical protein
MYGRRGNGDGADKRMDMVALIIKKRDGGTLTPEESAGSSTA